MSTSVLSVLTYNNYYFNNLPESASLYYETDEERESRYEREHLKEELMLDVENIADNALTSIQFTYFDLFKNGLTYADIARVFEVTPTTIHYAFKGKKHSVNGGIFNKLKIALLSDKKFISKYSRFI